MKSVWRDVLIAGIGVVIEICSIELAAAQLVQRVTPYTPSYALSWYRLRPTLASGLASSALQPGQPSSARYTKLRFTPVKIRGPERVAAVTAKTVPPLSRTFDQKFRIPDPPSAHVRFGVSFDMEAGYGDHDTLIGYLRHGTQFQRSHYALTGHWERTRHATPEQREEHLTTRLTYNLDLTDAATLILTGGYTQSQVALPQLSGDASHFKTLIQARAGYQTNLTPTLAAGFIASWEDARFRDEHDIDSTLLKYGGQFSLRANWSAKQTVSLDTSGAWERLDQGQTTRNVRYYGSTVLLNSFAMHDRFSVDTGAQLDYYHFERVPHINYHIAPVITVRWQMFRQASWYAQYRPRLKIPDFTDLYLRKLYTTVNPELHSEKQQHYVEVGLQQRMGEAVVLNVGGFYHDSRDFIFQIDPDADHILEYDHMPAIDFLGARINLQMNYRERLALNTTYTYTTHSIFSAQQVSAASADFRNQILPYQPNHQVQAGLTWTLPFGLTVNVNGLYVSEQYRNRSMDQAPIERQFFINAEATQQFSENISIFVAGRNLTDISTYDIIPWLNSEEITSSRLLLGGIRMRF